MTTQVNVEQIILDALKQKKGYVTVPYLAQISGASPEDVQAYVDQHPKNVRKSQIETDNGESLYTFNAPLSGISDAWTAFRSVNAKKY